MQSLIVSVAVGSNIRRSKSIELSFSKCWYCGIGARLCKYWNIYWVLIELRLTKSGIEYVILAGSSLFPLSGAKSRFLPVMVVVLARAVRDFSRIWAFGHLKSQNFRWPAGGCAESGVPAQQILEHFLRLNGLSKCWINLFNTFRPP